MRVNRGITYHSYIHLLRRRSPFALSRWGDGEWLATLGAGPNQIANADGTKYTEPLKTALRRTLQNPHQHPYYYGILNIAMSHLGDDIREWLGRTSSQIEWVDGDALLDASLRGDLARFVHEVRAIGRTSYVGPRILKSAIMRFFPDANYIEVPESTAFDVWPETSRAITASSSQVVLFSAGMASNVIMHDVWSRTGGSITLIDCGSMFDGYANRTSRSYIQKYDWNRLREANLGNGQNTKQEDFRVKR